MYCYWTGEATIGKSRGIIETKIGHMNGSEIVFVKYDDAFTSSTKLKSLLKAHNSFYADKTLEKGNPHFIESKHSLRTANQALYYVDLSEGQAIKLNSWAYYGGSFPKVLTPKQLATYKKIEQTIKRKGKPKMIPLRSGKGLLRYRAYLAKWLNG